MGLGPSAHAAWDLWPSPRSAVLTLAMRASVNTVLAATDPSSLAIADLSGDGRPDLGVANYGESTVSVLLGNGDGTFGGRSDFGTGSRSQS